MLDSHTLVWAVDAVALLGPQAVVELKDPANQLLLSLVGNVLGGQMGVPMSLW